RICFSTAFSSRLSSPPDREGGAAAAHARTARRTRALPVMTGSPLPRGHDGRTTGEVKVGQKIIRSKGWRTDSAMRPANPIAGLPRLYNRRRARTTLVAISLSRLIEELTQMLSRNASRLLGAGVILAMLAFSVVAAHADKQDKDKPIDYKALRDKHTKSYRDGNYKDAYEGLRKLALDAKNDPKLVGGDLHLAITCLRNLGRVDEIDEFRESVIAKHNKNWRLLQTAAISLHHGEHYGFIVAGEFSRGWKRGHGRYVGTFQRDRGRALQLM